MTFLRERTAVLLLYLLGSALVFELHWTCAVAPEGGYYPGVGQLADGPGSMPFVRPRLVFDAARAVAEAVPPRVWSGVVRAVSSTGPVAHRVKALLDEKNWRQG